MTADERMKARLAKQIGKVLCDCGWYWHGVEFRTFSWLGVSQTTAFVRFSARMYTLTVSIDMEKEYGLADEEKTFTGENALGDAVEWVTEVLLDLYKTVTQRTKPYQKGYEAYLKAVKGI